MSLASLLWFRPQAMLMMAFELVCGKKISLYTGESIYLPADLFFMITEYVKPVTVKILGIDRYCIHCFELLESNEFHNILWNQCYSWGIKVRGFRGILLPMNLSTYCTSNSSSFNDIHVPGPVNKSLPIRTFWILVHKIKQNGNTMHSFNIHLWLSLLNYILRYKIQ